MKKLSKKMLCIAMACVMTFLTGCGGKSNQEAVNDATPTPTTAPVETKQDATPEPAPLKGEPTVLKFGTHYVQELDPNYKDEVTGEYTMAENMRQAYLKAADKILEDYNVKFEFIQYSGDTKEVLLQSVMAGDPVCDIAWMWGGSEGTILAQNVLQKLDDYKDIFLNDEDAKFMLYDPIFGSYYFLGTLLRFTPRWPLVYNIDYIEAVDTLKDADGNTIYPTTLFEQGNWTWSAFKDYLSKIEAFYAGSSAPNRPERRIDAYQTDYRFAALSACYTNGGAVYGTNGLQVASNETKEGVAYIKDLMNSKLLTCETYDDSYTPGWTWNGNNFQSGETVFTDIPDWFINGASSSLAERGQSLGIIPWPRPDDMAIDDENYRQLMTASDSIGILKGVSKEKTELALKALKTYFMTYYEALGNTSTVSEYKEDCATQKATELGFDIFHEKIGDSILSAFQYVSKHSVNNDYADLIGIRSKWDDIVMNSLYGVNGTASYDVAIEANMNVFDEVVNNMTSILAATEIRDNMCPNISSVAPKPFAFPLGTKAEDIVWSNYIKAEDSVDGIIDPSAGTYDLSATDFNTVGVYSAGVALSIADKAGNAKDKTYDILVYNPDNTIQPTLVTKEEYRTIVLDEDTSAINWAADFVESATDADGLSLTGMITADLSQLDTSTPGEYEVVLTVIDYAGNEASATLKVTVAAAN